MKAEQTSKQEYTGRKHRKLEKWKAKRARRREEKKDPENAPKKLKGYLRGWTD